MEFDPVDTRTLRNSHSADPQRDEDWKMQTKPGRMKNKRRPKENHSEEKVRYVLQH